MTGYKRLAVFFFSLLILVGVLSGVNASTTSTITDAADRLIALQNPTGSWAWIVTDATEPTTENNYNLAGVTAEGLLDAYKLTGTQKYLDAAKKAGDYIVSVPISVTQRQNSASILFLYHLYDITGITIYKDKADAIMNHILHQDNYWSSAHPSDGVEEIHCSINGCTAQQLLDAYKDYRSYAGNLNGYPVWDLYQFVEDAKIYGDNAFANDVTTVLKNFLDQSGFDNTKPGYVLALSGGIIGLGKNDLDYSSYLTKLIAAQNLDGHFESVDYPNEHIQPTSYALIALSYALETSASANAGLYLSSNFGYSSPTVNGWLEGGSEYAEVNSEAAHALFERYFPPQINNIYIEPQYPNCKDESRTVYVYSTITDENGIKGNPELRWRIVGSSTYESPSMIFGGDEYYAGITGPRENGKEIEYKIVAYDNLDNMGQTSNLYQHLFTYDCAAPTTSDNSVSFSAWQPNGVTITLTPSDGTGSGVASTKYCVDQTNSCTPSISGTSVLVNIPGINYIRYNSVDNAGNPEDVKSATSPIKIDMTLPIISDDYLLDGIWTNIDQTVTLTPSDLGGSEIKEVKYCEGTGCTPNIPLSSSGVSGSITVRFYDAEGNPISIPDWFLGSDLSLSFTSSQNTIVRYQTWDNAENPSVIGEFNVKIDKIVPVTTDNVPTEWRNAPFNVLLTEPTPDGFSSATTYYKTWIVGGTEPTEWTQGNSISISTDGQYNIKYQSRDEAGNVETEKAAINLAKLDTILPLVTINAVTTPTSTATQTITGTFTETNIDTIIVNGLSATLDIGAGTYSAPITLSTEGNNLITVIATDKAGNTGIATNSVVLDTANPTLSIFAPLTNGTSIDAMSYYLVKASTSDATSGIKDVLLTLKKGTSVILDNVPMTLGTSDYEYSMRMWELEAGSYTLDIIAEDNAGNSFLQIRTFTIAENVAPSRIVGLNTNVPVEGGTVRFRFNVTVRGDGIVQFGMDDIAGLSPSAFNARISQDGITFADVGNSSYAGSETLTLSDLDPSKANVQGSFVLYLNVPKDLVPGTYSIHYYIHSD